MRRLSPRAEVNKNKQTKMENKKAEEEATRILIERHSVEFQSIYERKLRELKKFGGLIR